MSAIRAAAMLALVSPICTDWAFDHPLAGQDGSTRQTESARQTESTRQTESSSQEAPSLLTPHYTRLVTLDSLEIQDAEISPDREWVVFTALEDDRLHLWIASTSSGEPVRLTSGPHRDERPAWFSTSDRIVFFSTRPSTGTDQRECDGCSGPAYYLMTLSIDPRTGRAAGLPRQVSVEPVRPLAAVPTPDGAEIIYHVQQFDAGRPIREIRAVPSNGGRHRTLYSSPNTPWNLVMSDDGRFVYFSTGRSSRQRHTFMRAPVDGGEAEELGLAEPGPEVIGLGGSRYIASVGSGGGGSMAIARGLTLDLARTSGGAIGRFSLHPRMSVKRLLGDGTSLTIVRKDMVLPATVAPLNGGPPRHLNTPDSEDVLLGLGFLDDGRVALRTHQNGSDVILVTSSTTGTATEIPMPDCFPWPEFPMAIAPDGARLMCVADTGDREYGAVRLYDLGSGEARDLGRVERWGGGHLLLGRGGTLFRDADDLLFREPIGDSVVFFRVPPDGLPRRIASIPEESTFQDVVAVHGDRLAYGIGDIDKGEMTLYVKDGEQAPRPVLERDGRVVGFSSTWSPDGRWLATQDCALAPFPQCKVLVIPIDESGNRAGEPRELQGGGLAPLVLAWLPDQSALVELGAEDAEFKLGTWLLPLHDGGTAERLLGPNDMPVSISPDGRYLAYTQRIVQGSSIWLVELEGGN
jgi:Tol biopolymer transport system component